MTTPLAAADATLLLGACVTAIATVLAGWWGHATARKKLSPELRQLAASTEKTIADAATAAVGVINAALDTAREQLADANTKLDELRRELQAARTELAKAQHDRDERAELVTALKAEVRRLEARVAELEARLGGRRDTDPPGPMLG